MNINIQSKSSIPIYEQIKNQLKESIIAGEMKEGEPIPSIRILARDLKISVITTKRAYEELEKEGLIYSVAGKGFYVDNPDTGYLVEKKVQGLEEQLDAVLKLCKEAQLSKEEVKDMVDILWEE
ncbi:MAG: GntR family transcriptional regulator [Lachnospiraceae bacterium]|nr:GntR family transcriptional regulator [Lachnospiraceae bacterium]